MKDTLFFVKSLQSFIMFVDENPMKMNQFLELFEGEGCITHRKDGNWQLELQMTDQDVVKHFASMYGMTVREQARHPNKLILHNI